MTRLVDEFLPDFDFSDEIGTVVAADPATTWNALMEADLIEVGRRRPLAGCSARFASCPMSCGSGFTASTRRRAGASHAARHDRAADERRRLGAAGERPGRRSCWLGRQVLAPGDRVRRRRRGRIQDFAEPGFAKTVYALGASRTRTAGRCSGRSCAPPRPMSMPAPGFAATGCLASATALTCWSRPARRGSRGGRDAVGGESRLSRTRRRGSWNRVAPALTIFTDPRLGSPFWSQVTTDDRWVFRLYTNVLCLNLGSSQTSSRMSWVTGIAMYLKATAGEPTYGPAIAVAVTLSRSTSAGTCFPRPLAQRIGSLDLVTRQVDLVDLGRITGQLVRPGATAGTRRNGCGRCTQNGEGTINAISFLAERISTPLTPGGPANHDRRTIRSSNRAPRVNSGCAQRPRIDQPPALLGRRPGWLAGGGVGAGVRGARGGRDRDMDALVGQRPLEQLAGVEPADQRPASERPHRDHTRGRARRRAAGSAARPRARAGCRAPGSRRCARCASPARAHRTHRPRSASRRGSRSGPRRALPPSSRGAHATRPGCAPARGRRARRRTRADRELAPRLAQASWSRSWSPPGRRARRWPSARPSTPSARPYIGEESKNRVPPSQTASTTSRAAPLLLAADVERLPGAQPDDRHLPARASEPPALHDQAATPRGPSRTAPGRGCSVRAHGLVALVDLLQGVGAGHQLVEHQLAVAIQRSILGMSERGLE